MRLMSVFIPQVTLIKPDTTTIMTVVHHRDCFFTVAHHNLQKEINTLVKEMI